MPKPLWALLVTHPARNLPYRYTGIFKNKVYWSIAWNNKKGRKQIFTQRIHMKYSTSIQRNSLRWLKWGRFVELQDIIVKCKMQDTEQVLPYLST